jgi:hypothetical protein
MTMTAKTNAERQAEFRQRKAQQQTTEVRGIFAHPEDHADIKSHARLVARRRAARGAGPAAVLEALAVAHVPPPTRR